MFLNRWAAEVFEWATMLLTLRTTGLSNWLGLSAFYSIIRNPKSNMSKSSFLQRLWQSFPLSLSTPEAKETAESRRIFVAISGNNNDPTVSFRVVYDSWNKIIQWGTLYLFIANFFATQIRGGAKEHVVLLWLSGDI